MYDDAIINSYSPDDWLLGELARKRPEYFLAEWLLKGGDLDSWREKLTSGLRAALALDSVEPVERDVKLLDRYEDDGITFDRLLITTETGVSVPALMLLPHTWDLPLPGVVVCPDRGESKFATVLPRWTMPGDPDRSLVRRLVDDHNIVLVIDPIGGGERAANELGQAAVGAWMGRPLLGRAVHEAICGIDVLEPMQQVATDRLAVVGFGTGGAAALHALALDKRFRVGAVSGQLGSHADRVRHLIKHRWQGIEDQLLTMCPGVFGLAELSDVASLCAPQPLMMIHAEGDPGCP
ncbi:MAG TPA: hypothetical protein QGH10_18895, partial [Armatimonadota bacterium]|nr:hypothetical protein [Armatimonadota bacterium]